MKNFLFACVFAIISTQAFSQESSPEPKRALGVNLYSSTTFDEMWPWVYHPTGINYTCNNGKRTWRIAVNGAKSPSSYGSVNLIQGVKNGRTGTQWVYEVFAGIQKTFKDWKHIDAYWYSDAGINVAGFTGLETYGDSSIVYFGKPYVTRSQKFGVTPGLGLKYLLGKHLLFSIEADIFVYYKRYRYVQSERYFNFPRWTNDWMPQLHKVGVSWAF